MEALEAVAIGPCAGTRAAVRLADGTEREITVPISLSDLICAGMRVILYCEAGGELVGWSLPERQVGHDLRG